MNTRQTQVAAPKATPARSRAPHHEVAPESPRSPGPGNLETAYAAAPAAGGQVQPGAPDAPEERAADHLARQVLTAPSPGPCACGGSCPACRGRAGAVGTRALGGNPVSSSGGGWPFAADRGQPLAMTSRRWFEDRLGTPLDHVRIHDDRETAGHAHGLGARAFAVGSRIGFAEGEYRPGTPAGRAVLAHELAHVALGHGGLRRLGGSEGRDEAFLQAQREIVTNMVAKTAAATLRHKLWSGAVEKRWGGELGEQSKDITAERERVALSLSGIQAKAFDAAGEGTGWLSGALELQGYDGPSISDVKQLWAQALVAADAIKLSAEADPKDASKTTVSAETRLAALSAISAYYLGAQKFAQAAEVAHAKHVEEENARAAAQYDSEKKAFDEHINSFGATVIGVSMMALPVKPTPIVAPPPASGTFTGQEEAVANAKSQADWEKVAANLRTSAGALAKLVVASLPVKSELAAQALATEALGERLAAFDEGHTSFERVPAVFYPKDAGSNQTDPEGNTVLIPDMVPWQFYLTSRTWMDNSGDSCVVRGQWNLIDLTNPKAAVTPIDTSMGDAVRMSQGESIDPPIALFTPLNSKLRFPEGLLYFKLPSGDNYVHQMTEPWSASDWLSAIGLAFAAVALVAGVVATGGAAAPAAIAFGAGLASAGFGTAGTLMELKEKSEHGLLTDKDKDRAMIDIGLNVISAASMGLGRVVTAPGAAVRFGSRFGLMAGGLKVLRVANLGGDLAQVGLVTDDLITGYQSIKDNPNLSKEDRERMIGQLTRRALLTGAMMTVAIRGDVSDLKANGLLHISHVDADGVPASRKSADIDATAPKPHAEGGVPAAPHEKVTGEVHAEAETNRTKLDLAGNRHAVGVSGSGPNRDIYFCSDYCTSLVNRLGPVVAALPKNHPMRPAFEEMLRKANKARTDLQAGKIDDDAARKIAGDVRDQLGRLTKDSDHGTTLQNLLDMSPEVLAPAAEQVSAALAKKLDIHSVRAEAEAEFAPVITVPLRADPLAKIKRPPTWLVAPEGVIDAKSRRFLPDFDQRIAGTGGIEKIRAGLDPDGLLEVTIDGTLKPGRLSRNPKRTGEGVSLAPSFNQQARSQLGGLAESGLKGWQRLHLWGPGFGDEAAAGMMLGPSSVNQIWQNGDIHFSGTDKHYMGIEGFLRELSADAKAIGGTVKLSATATAYGNPTPGGFKVASGEPVLKSATYTFSVVDADGKVTSSAIVNVNVPDPAGWKNPASVVPGVSAHFGHADPKSP